MRKNITPLGRLKAGRPKTTGLKTHRKNYSSGISTNYKIMLEIYCINKKEAGAKRELKYQSLGVRKSVSRTVNPSFSIRGAISSFFEESLLLFRKLKPRMAMATVTE